MALPAAGQQAVLRAARPLAPAHTSDQQTNLQTHCEHRPPSGDDGEPAPRLVVQPQRDPAQGPGDVRAVPPGTHGARRGRRLSAARRIQATQGAADAAQARRRGAGRAGGGAVPRRVRGHRPPVPGAAGRGSQRLRLRRDQVLQVVSPEGAAFTAYFPEDTLIEEVKNRSIDYFYPNGETGASRFKMVRVCDTATLHDFLTLAQEQVSTQDELLLIERRIPEAGALWDLGAVRAPQAAAIAAATASLPAPQNTVRQPNLQSLLSTNELSFELRKILISLIEAGARLAAAGRNYEMTLAQLSAALDEPQRTQQIVVQVITPEEIAARFNQPELQTIPETPSSGGNEQYKRAEHLQRFLEKFRAWRAKIAEPPNPEAVAALKDLGFSVEESDNALRNTGCNVPAAASWLIGERGSSVFELINGLPDGLILQTLLKQPQIQRGLLNTRMLIAFIAMVGQTGSASLWLNSPHGSPLLSQISRTYHSEKYCLAVNQFSDRQENSSNPSTSRQKN